VILFHWQKLKRCMYYSAALFVGFIIAIELQNRQCTYHSHESRTVNLSFYNILYLSYSLARSERCSFHVVLRRQNGYKKPEDVLGDIYSIFVDLFTHLLYIIIYFFFICFFQRSLENKKETSVLPSSSLEILHSSC
jgi:hypothetical protein